ncbi:hypothetical protein WJX84_004172 [Apatococcus fuscideae]
MLSTQLTAVRGTPVQAISRPAPCRCSTVVRASAEQPAQRRAVLGGLMAGVVGLSALSANAIDVTDDRKVRDLGFDIIYEARDLDLPQDERDGLKQFRGSLDDTKKRVKISEGRIDSVLEPYIKKAYWTAAREELRLQLGTLRFDLNTLGATKPNKTDKKKAILLKQDFIKKAEELDFALRQKIPEKCNEDLKLTKESLDKAIAFVL